jgi:PAS domain S-box-containing protein
MLIHGDQQRMTWFSIHARRAVITDHPYLVVVGIDIDERKRAEEELIGYKRWLGLAMEAADSGVWDWNVKTDEVIWSDEIWPLYGLKKNEHKPSFKLWASTIHPDDRKMAVSAIKRAALCKAELNIEYRILHPDSSVHWIMASGRAMFDNHAKVIRYCGTVIDISEQKQIEHELQRSRAHLDFALEKCHIGWWEMDLEDFSVLRTLEHARIFGYDTLALEWSFDSLLEHILPEDRARIKSIVTSSIEKKKDYAFECRIISATGEPRWIWTSGTIQFDFFGKATHILGIVQDVTDRKQEEEEFEKLQMLFQQSQKMELVGQLAGGIAHDFNNALTAILGNTELLLDRVDKSSPLVEHIRDIQQSATRSANLTRQLLAFARREAAMPKTVYLNREIENLLPMLRGLIGSNIQFVWVPNARDLCVHIDPSQLDQIIVNFCINSRDAISENGTITIETSEVHVDAIDCAIEHPCQMPGDYVRISVSDTGSGIDQKTLPHIFEPFFTTKDVGKGTGLGLSTVYGVLKQNHGFIDCRTRIGSGTTFDVYLPVHDTAKEGGELEDQLSFKSHARETILLVEDELSILKILSGLLREKGYTTLAAQDARTALEIAEQFPDEIDLLVTDIVLPDMNGVRLSDQLETSRPRLKTLFMSGYAQEMIAHYNKLAEGLNFIQKPFAIKSFMDMVSQMLHDYKKVEARPYRARSG